MATPAEVARLQAGATGGTAGVKAFDDAAAQVKTTRNEAIAAMRADNALIRAPAALTAQLEGQLMAPAATALANLSSLGGAAQYARSQDQTGTARYMDEARAALPVITAEIGRDESQREALLAAQNAGRSSSGGQLSDSELRIRLLGEAESIRRQEELARQQQYQQGLADLAGRQRQRVQNIPSGSLGPLGPMGPGSSPTSTASGPQGPLGPLGPQGPAQLAAPAVDARQFQSQANRVEYDRVHQARAAALARIENELHGPGITREAQQLGIDAGLPAGLVSGLLGPNEERQYLNAQKGLGLYQPPGETRVAQQTLDPMAAARAIGMSTKDAEMASGLRHFLWSDNGSAANKGLLKFVKERDLDGKLYNNLTTPADVAKARADFAATDLGRQFATNVLADVLADAHRAVGQGLDYTTWRQNLIATPEYEQYPRAFALAFAQAAPLFAYQAAQQRTLTGG